MDELLQYEYANIKEDNPEIEGDFDLKEKLETISELKKSNPKKYKETRGILLKELKEAKKSEKRERQEEAVADCTVFVERIIENDPDAKKDALMAWVEKFGKDYAFTKDQKKVQKTLLIDIWKKGKKLKKCIKTIKITHWY